MKTILSVSLPVLLLFCLLYQVGNVIFEAFLVTAVVSVILWIAYVCCKSQKMVIGALYALLVETIAYYLYGRYHLEEVCFVEQLPFVIKWCCFNFALAIIALFIPRIKKISPFFWVNGIVTPILFLYCASHLG